MNIIVGYRISIFNAEKRQSACVLRSPVPYLGLLIMKDAFNMIGIISLSFFFLPRVFITQLFYILIFLESIK